MPVCGYAQAVTDPARDLRDESLRQNREQHLSESAPGWQQSGEYQDLNTPPDQIGEPEGSVMLEHLVVVDLGAAGGLGDLLDRERLEALLQPYRNVPIGVQRLTALLRQLKAELVKNGWITSTAHIKTLDWQSRNVEIELLPGSVAGLASPDASARALAQVFPLCAGDTLALQDIEQGVQQINRLRLNQAEVRIVPSGTTNAHSLEASIKNQGRYWGSLGVDNAGSFATGKIRSRASLNAENLFDRFESIGLTYLQTRRSRAMLSAISLPDGYNTWSASISAADYSQPVLGEFTQNGQSYSGLLGFNRTLTLTASRHDSIDLSLSRSYAGRRFEGIALAPERLSVLRAAYTSIMKGSDAQAFGEIAIASGLPAFGALHDSSALTKDDAHAQFTKIELHAALDAAIGASRWRYNAQFDWQYASRGLYGAEQFQIGGVHTVRGFNEGVASGERGYLLRQELRLPVFKMSLNPSAIPAVQAGPASDNPAEATLAPYLFVDAGRAIPVSDAVAKLASIGAGLRAYVGSARLDTSAGRPIQKSANVEDYGWHVHFSLSYDW